eukprot:TRINITY_DN8521_c0_g1_i4.p1 TRINITY_DN8521_c0_g1~~TRINITY_DN8521_c0_g1_i4.p1  ORF type:complete len:2193 (+),score=386.86 TRINITY_DN8521_c0_g1_i4:133-6579(+)
MADQLIAPGNVRALLEESRWNYNRECVRRSKQSLTLVGLLSACALAALAVGMARSDPGTDSPQSSVEFAEEAAVIDPVPVEYPNANMIAQGYHIYYADPAPPYRENADSPGAVITDPGLKSSVFSLEYTKGKLTADHRHKVPDGYSATVDIGCSNSFTTKEIRNSYDYSVDSSRETAVSAGVDVSVGYEFPDSGNPADSGPTKEEDEATDWTPSASVGASASAGASGTLTATNSELREEQTFKTQRMIRSMSKCSSYVAALEWGALPKTHPDFQASVDDIQRAMQDRQAQAQATEATSSSRRLEVSGEGEKFYESYHNYCLTPDGGDALQDGNTATVEDGRVECGKRCSAVEGCTGYEWYQARWNGKNCFLFWEPAFVDHGQTAGAQWRDAECHPKLFRRFLTPGGEYCPKDQDIITESECKSSAAKLGLIYSGSWHGPNDHKYCLFANDGRDKVYFNTASVELTAEKPILRYQSVCLDRAGIPEAAGYIGCLSTPLEWTRIEADGSKGSALVDISEAGALTCQERCSTHGYMFFGLECPQATGKVHCQCSSAAKGTRQKDNFCEGNGVPLVHSHNHCTGPYFADGYRFGDYSVSSVYLTDPETWTKWWDLFDKYGTHFMTTVKMGARYSVSSYFDNQEYYTMETEVKGMGVDVGVAASASAGATVSAGPVERGKEVSVEAEYGATLLSPQEKQAANAMTNYIQKQDISVIGAKMTAEGLNKWKEETDAKPVPIQNDRRSICLQPSIALDSNMKQQCFQAMSWYCEGRMVRKGAPCEELEAIECMYDLDCDGAVTQVCRNSKCVDVPQCEVRITRDPLNDNGGGQDYRLETVDAIAYPNGLEINLVNANWNDLITGIDMSSGCEKVWCEDDDKNRNKDNEYYYSSKNALPYDLDNDVIRIRIYAKPPPPESRRLRQETKNGTAQVRGLWELNEHLKRRNARKAELRAKMAQESTAQKVMTKESGATKPEFNLVNVARSAGRGMDVDGRRTGETQTEYLKTVNVGCGYGGSCSSSYNANWGGGETAAYFSPNGYSVELCKIQCSDHEDCAGFNYDRANVRCYYRTVKNGGTTCGNEPNTDRDCYERSVDVFAWPDGTATLARAAMSFLMSSSAATTIQVVGGFEHRVRMDPGWDPRPPSGLNVAVVTPTVTCNEGEEIFFGGFVGMDDSTPDDVSNGVTITLVQETNMLAEVPVLGAAGSKGYFDVLLDAGPLTIQMKDNGDSSYDWAYIDATFYCKMDLCHTEGADEAGYIKNIGKGMYGYNHYYGAPSSTDTAGTDPGFKHRSLWEASYNEGRLACWTTFSAIPKSQNMAANGEKIKKSYVKSQGFYLAGCVADDACKKRDERDAEARCDKLGPDCSGYTCINDRSCTIRAGYDLLSSPSNEYSFKKTFEFVAVRRLNENKRKKLLKAGPRRFHDRRLTAGGSSSSADSAGSAGSASAGDDEEEEIEKSGSVEIEKGSETSSSSSSSSSSGSGSSSSSGSSSGSTPVLRVPDGWKVSMGASSYCEQMFETQEVKSEFDYEAEASSSIGIGVEAGPVSFGFSKENTEFRSSNGKQSMAQYNSRAECIDYIMEIEDLENNPPPIKESFAKVAREARREEDFHILFDMYGLEFPTQLVFGARYGYTRFLSENGYTSVSENTQTTSVEAGVSVEVGQTVCAGACEAGVSAEYGMEDTQATAATKSVQENSQEVREVTVGKRMPDKGGIDEWVKVVGDEPMPFRFNLRSICEHPAFKPTKQTDPILNSFTAQGFATAGLNGEYHKVPNIMFKLKNYRESCTDKGVYRNQNGFIFYYNPESNRWQGVTDRKMDQVCGDGPYDANTWTITGCELSAEACHFGSFEEWTTTVIRSSGVTYKDIFFTMQDFMNEEVNGDYTKMREGAFDSLGGSLDTAITSHGVYSNILNGWLMYYSTGNNRWQFVTGSKMKQVLGGGAQDGSAWVSSSACNPAEDANCIMGSFQEWFPCGSDEYRPCDTQGLSFTPEGRCKAYSETYCPKHLAKTGDSETASCSTANRFETECLFDMDCESYHTCDHNRRCVWEPDCTVTVFEDSGFGGSSKVFGPYYHRERPDGERILLGDWESKISSAKLSGGCAEATFMDQDNCMEQHQHNQLVDLRNTNSGMDIGRFDREDDLNDDVCKIYIKIKEKWLDQ